MTIEVSISNIQNPYPISISKDADNGIGNSSTGKKAKFINEQMSDVDNGKSNVTNEMLISNFQNPYSISISKEAREPNKRNMVNLNNLNVKTLVPQKLECSYMEDS